MKYIANVVRLIVAISACSLPAGCSIKESFQPLPPMFKNWEKDRSSPEEVKKALLKCGYDNPYNGFEPQAKVTINELARSSKCMRDSGFRYLLGDGRIICDFAEWRNLPACQ
jgi:hypothetical protein